MRYELRVMSRIHATSDAVRHTPSVAGLTYALACSPVLES